MQLFAHGQSHTAPHLASTVTLTLQAQRTQELMRAVLQAPNKEALLFQDRYDEWRDVHKCTTVTSTRDTFIEMFDNDDTLEYEPAQTAALILTGGDEEAEQAALEVMALSLHLRCCAAGDTRAVQCLWLPETCDLHP